MPKSELTEREKFLSEDSTGFCGLKGMDAVMALRGASPGATVEERVLHAIGVVTQAQPGYQSVALGALEAALREIRSKP